MLPHDDPTLATLAREGLLASAFAAADGPERRGLLRSLYDVVWPIVFSRITRPAESRRGHRRCAKGFGKLLPECADRFYDDVAAVIHEVVRRATRPIADLGAWIASMAKSATVDAYRRRRGEIGALQRPRLPGWLAEELGDVPWRRQLAVHVLEWVGVPTTAGAWPWPLGTWAEWRAEATGDWQGSTPEVVAREVEIVLAAMRTRTRWFSDHVEKPMGHKQTPTAPNPDPLPPLELTEHESAETYLAALAINRITRRLSRGERPEVVVPEVVRQLFCDGDATGEWLAQELLDDAGAARVVDAVLLVVGGHLALLPVARPVTTDGRSVS
ncbi:hypothetical protein ABZ345_08385 [Lentzea sp. NPDC005914]|uniref:hypothetical protein n=1 Tax=Lentzea sp. NPDC005914 TaxID=3154572 RepID=UPI0033D4755C